MDKIDLDCLPPPGMCPVLVAHGGKNESFCTTPCFLPTPQLLQTLCASALSVTANTPSRFSLLPSRLALTSPQACLTSSLFSSQQPGGFLKMEERLGHSLHENSKWLLLIALRVSPHFPPPRGPGSLPLLFLSLFSTPKHAICTCHTASF